MHAQRDMGSVEVDLVNGVPWIQQNDAKTNRLMNLASGMEEEQALMDKLKGSLPLLHKLPYGKHIMYALREQGFMTEEEVSQALEGFLARHSVFHDAQSVFFQSAAQFISYC